MKKEFEAIMLYSETAQDTESVLCQKDITFSLDKPENLAENINYISRNIDYDFNFIIILVKSKGGLYRKFDLQYDTYEDTTYESDLVSAKWIIELLKNNNK